MFYRSAETVVPDVEAAQLLPQLLPKLPHLQSACPVQLARLLDCWPAVSVGLPAGPQDDAAWHQHQPASVGKLPVAALFQHACSAPQIS